MSQRQLFPTMVCLSSPLAREARVLCASLPHNNKRQGASMPFPFSVSSSVQIGSLTTSRSITLHSGLTVILGPNGSGKTHLMRGLKQELRSHCAGKQVRFLSAGRVGMFEQFRSDYDGRRGVIQITKVRATEIWVTRSVDTATKHCKVTSRHLRFVLTSLSKSENDYASSFQET